MRSDNFELMNWKNLSAVAFVVLLVSSSLSVVAMPVAASSTSSPSGMTAVPNSQISKDVPSGQSVPINVSMLEGHIWASQYAGSLNVTITTPSHAQQLMGPHSNVVGGGKVALVISDPTHHSGRDIGVDAGVLKTALGYSPSFVYGSHSGGNTWRSKATYTSGALVFHVKHFSTNTVTFAGTVDVNGTFQNGSSTSYTLSGTDSVSAPNVTLTGRERDKTDTMSGTAKQSTTGTPISIGGNMPPMAPDGTSGAGQLVVSPATERLNLKSTTAENGSHTWQTNASTGTWIQKVHVREDNYAGTASQIHVSISIGSTTVATNTWSNPGYGATRGIDIPINQSTNGQSVTVSIDNGGKIMAWSYLSPVKTAKGTITTPSGGSQSVDLSHGQSATRDLSLSQTDSALNWSVSSGKLSWSLNTTARTSTPSGAVSINGHPLSFGSLAPGATATLTGAKSWLRSGQNNVSVSLSSASTTPSPAVKMDYRHSARSSQSVNYSAEKFSERYNVSKTFATHESGATLSIPFTGNVVGIRKLQEEMNGGAWNDVSPSGYSLQNTTLTVQLGSVNANESVGVRAVGSKIGVSGGSVQVTNPTTMSATRLDSQLYVKSRNSSAPLTISVPGQLMHYVYQSTWGASAHSVITGSTNKVVLPSAADGGTFRLSTIPVEAIPQGGAERVTVPNPTQTSPSFKVSPTSSSTSKVVYAYTQAQAGKPYGLMSVSSNIQRDSGTASSAGRVALVDDNSPETLQFKELTAPNGSAVGSGSGSRGAAGGGGSQRSSAVGSLLHNPVLLLGGGLVLLGAVAWALRRWWGVSTLGGLEHNRLFLAASVVVIYFVEEFASGWMLTTWAVSALSTMQQFVLLVVFGLGGYYVYKKYIKGASSPSKVTKVNFQLSGNKSKEDK